MKHPIAFLRLRASALVDPKMIRRPIVGHQKIGISALAERPGEDAQPRSRFRVQPHFIRDVLEPPLPQVVVSSVTVPLNGCGPQ